MVFRLTFCALALALLIWGVIVNSVGLLVASVAVALLAVFKWW